MDDLLMEITAILNDPTISWKVKRALLREKCKLSEKSIDELCPRPNEVTYD